MVLRNVLNLIIKCLIRMTLYYVIGFEKENLKVFSV